jgi:hypothetical protein
VLLHELGEDRVLALEFGLEVGDLLVRGVGVSLAALVMTREGGLAVLEEELLPRIEEGDTEAVFFTEIGDRDLVEDMLSKHSDLRRRGEVTTWSD